MLCIQRLFARSRFLERDEASGSACHMSLQRLQACTSKDDDDDEGAELLGHILDIEYGRSPDMEQSFHLPCPLMDVC